MRHYNPLTFFCCILIICGNNLKAQSTPDDLGKIIFNSFQQGSVSKLDYLIPTLEEMKKIAEVLDTNKNSDQYNKMIKNRDTQITEFQENLNWVYSDTLDNGLNWKITKLEKITTSMDSIQMNGKNAPVATVNIYFTCNLNRFVITLNDVFPCGELWKTGSSVYMKQIN
ncbi:hypothetical protein ACQ33O_06935 [Ferruginibacter sp. SUN002]|uniref:hypothetical protein n=1 Tax=Ferruginibacter sp. SUN002 TaxID=2937789 RepID=UPI003D35E5E0